jgi:hypothetical protein
MWQDPIVEEVRAAREAYAKRFGGDWKAMYEDLKRREAESGRELVSLAPKPTVAAGAGLDRTSR